MGSAPGGRFSTQTFVRYVPRQSEKWRGVGLWIKLEREGGVSGTDCRTRLHAGTLTGS